MSKRFPKGWDEKRVSALIDHYEHLTEDEAVAEDEAAYDDEGQTFVEVPNAILEQVRDLIAQTEGRDA